MRKIGFKKSLYRNQIIMGYLLLIPAVAFFIIFFCYSLLQAFHYSTLDWNGVTAATYVGLQNYVELFTDPVFGKHLLITLLYNWNSYFWSCTRTFISYILSKPGIKGVRCLDLYTFFPE